LSLNAQVIANDKDLGMNISQIVDELLTQEVERRRLAPWNEENRDAIEQYNARIEREGTFAQRIRQHLSTTAAAPPQATAKASGKRIAPSTSA
ncbi:MAG: type II toxin-antitoxin system CcdA family antitoxin, partial [Pseudorhodobacter sp.]|nr:type II toxin-antitoxin system CcdA family antitoxin [Rhizobacter sp.]